MVWGMIRCDREYAIDVTAPGFPRTPTPAGVEDGTGDETRRSWTVSGSIAPMPITMTKEAIGKLDIGEVLMVEADDPAAEEDIRRWANRMGQEIVKFRRMTGS